MFGKIGGGGGGGGGGDKSRNKVYDWKLGGEGGWHVLVWKHLRRKNHAIIIQNILVCDQGCKGMEGEELSDQGDISQLVYCFWCLGVLWPIISI